MSLNNYDRILKELLKKHAQKNPEKSSTQLEAIDKPDDLQFQA